MLGFDFKYKGQCFSDDLFDKPNGRGIVLTKVDWNDIITDDDQVARQGDHGIESTPTLYRGRIIDIEGTIVANSRSDRQIFRDILTEVFRLEYVPSPDNLGFNDFIFKDDDGTEWVISAKVLNTPAYDQRELNDFCLTDFKVQLKADDPIIRARYITQLIANEGFFGGRRFPTVFPIEFDEYGYATNLINAGNWISPLKVTITANAPTGSNLRIQRDPDHQFFGIKTPLSTGDVLVMDTATNTLTLNGVNVSGDRISGSIWAYLNPGDNGWVVLDDVSMLGDGLQVDCVFEWYNTKIS